MSRAALERLWKALEDDDRELARDLVADLMRRTPPRQPRLERCTECGFTGWPEKSSPTTSVSTPGGKFREAARADVQSVAC